MSSPSWIEGPYYRDARAFVLERLADLDWEPDEFFVSGRVAIDSWSFQKASEIMKTCQGAVILALPRSQGPDGSPHASEFIHFEGGLAVAHGVPRFIVAAEGVPDRGIVWTGGGDQIIYVPHDDDWAKRSQLRNRFERWLKSLETRKDVFLAYCSEARSTARDLEVFLSRQGVSVLDWEVDFQSGGTIIDQVDRATRECRFGIFLFTRDDPMEGDAPGRASPRDNVVFEAGYFMSAKGREQTLVIREDGAKMPADLGGIIYLALRNRSDITPIESRIRRFLNL